MRKVSAWTTMELARGAGIVVFVALLMPAMIWFAWPTSAQPPPPSVNGNCNNFGNNNSNCNTFNFAPVPRNLLPKQAAILSDSVRGTGISVLVTSPSNPEVNGYESQIMQALAAGGIKVQPFNIGTMSPPPYGIQVIPNGHDAKALLAALGQAGIKASITDFPLPVPGSINQRFSAFIGLIVGFREE